ncbi:MAG: hypothetical protein H0U70_01575 [Tatlockia sp.]|nr:hypothetical protein [Tatlockia sp.]
MAKGPFNSEKFNKLLHQIEDLPVNEIKYYLLLILRSIEDKNCPLMFEALENFNSNLNLFMNSKNAKDSANSLIELKDAYQALCQASQTHAFALQLGYFIINMGSVLLSFITGIIGGLIGSTAGFFRAIATCNNPLIFLADGFATGAACGASFGFRIAKKLLKNEFHRQLKLCLDSLADCIETFEEERIKPIYIYEQQIKEKLLAECFNNNAENFQEFLDSEQSYSIQTVSAQFISEYLDGYLGHHARIVIPLPNSFKPKLIEYAPESDEIDDRPLTQIEKRKVTGKKLVEMMALNEQLLITEPSPGLSDLVYSKMKLGERDCFSYVNKILVGSNQNGTVCRRFNGGENWVGRNIIGFFVNKLSPFPEEIFDSISVYSN